MSPLFLGLLGVILFLSLALFLGMPLGFALMAVGFVGVIYTRGLAPGLDFIGCHLYNVNAVYTFTVVALFTLMGQFTFYSGVGSDLYNTAHKWLGRLPGGLALATMVAGTGFAACTGSSVASASTLSATAFPEMERYHYNRGFATAVIATGGTLGILIPPSTTFIIYGFITGTSIAALFIAGIFPGLLLSALYLSLTFVMCKINPALGSPTSQHFSWKERLLSLRGVWGMVVLFMLVMGGLYIGVFSPNEAGGIGALGAFLIVIFRRRLTKNVFLNSLRQSARIVCSIMVIVSGALMFNIFLATSGFAAALSNWILGLSLSPHVFLSILLLAYIPIGSFMDAIAMTMLTLPIFWPVIINYGFDPIWLGVLLTVMFEMGLLTPPIGLNFFVVSSITKVPQREIIRGLIPFIAVMCVGEVILFIFPQISLFLPTYMRGF